MTIRKEQFYIYLFIISLKYISSYCKTNDNITIIIVQYSTYHQSVSSLPLHVQFINLAELSSWNQLTYHTSSHQVAGVLVVLLWIHQIPRDWFHHSQYNQVFSSLVYCEGLHISLCDISVVDLCYYYHLGSSLIITNITEVPYGIFRLPHVAVKYSTL